jgi:hypothetical protein
MSHIAVQYRGFGQVVHLANTHINISRVTQADVNLIASLFGKSTRLRN